MSYFLRCCMRFALLPILMLVFIFDEGRMDYYNGGSDDPRG